MRELKKTNNMDEMEKDIALKSIRSGFAFTTIILVVWGAVGVFTKNEWRVPLYILCTQNLICFISRQLYRKQMDDDRWKKDLSTFVVVFIIVLLIGLLIPFFMMGQK